MISEIISTSLSERNFNFELIQSSIYNFYANEPEFAKSFKNFFGPDKGANTIEEQVSLLSEMIIKFGGIGECFEKIPIRIIGRDEKTGLIGTGHCS